MILLWLAAAVIAATALTHSWLGERRLIGPLLALDSRVTSSALARAVIRFAWHLTSVLMLLTALVVAWPETPSLLVQATGATYLIVGIVDAVMSRGRHVGWPLLIGAGVLALAGSA